MSLANAAARQRAGGAGGRRSGRGRTITIQRLLAAFGLALTLVLILVPPAQAQADNDWVGKRVVQKVRDFTLRIDDEAVERSGKTIDFYRVERTDGPSLWLKAESQGVTGSAPADKVVPVEQAIEFFTQQIRARPQNAFPYAMRAFLRHDKQQLDLALRDYDQAIRLDPHDALIYCGRGIARQSNKEYDKAAADFDLVLRFDPKNTHAFIGCGISRAARREYTEAITDFNEAIWLDPLSVAGYYNRGLAWQSKREYQKAVVDYNLVIRLDPQHAHAYCQRGRAWATQKKYDKAIADFNEAIRLDPRYPDAYSGLAWILATCPDATVRDGEKAVAPAIKACELTGWNDRSRLDTLAAACAAAGDFESAVKWQTKANTLASGAEDQTKGEARINLYREKKPYLETNP